MKPMKGLIIPPFFIFALTYVYSLCFNFAFSFFCIVLFKIWWAKLHDKLGFCSPGSHRAGSTRSCQGNQYSFGGIPYNAHGAQITSNYVRFAPEGLELEKICTPRAQHGRVPFILRTSDLSLSF